MKYTVGLLGKYRAIPKNKKEESLLKEHSNIEFEAYSVGSADGQVAIFPTDEIGTVSAYKNAQLFCELLNFIENEK